MEALKDQIWKYDTGMCGRPVNVSCSILDGVNKYTSLLEVLFTDGILFGEKFTKLTAVGREIVY